MAKYVDLEANVTVSLSAEILGKRNAPDISVVGNGEEFRQTQSLWDIIRIINSLNEQANVSDVSE